MAEHVLRTGDLAQDLRPRPQRRSSVSLPRRCPGDLGAHRLPVSGDCFGQPGLPDTGISGEQQEIAARRGELVQQRADQRKLPVTPEQQPRWPRRRRRSHVGVRLRVAADTGLGYSGQRLLRQSSADRIASAIPAADTVSNIAVAL